FSFFFQAEDGIRDRTVTGVQTCALPILKARNEVPPYVMVSRVHACAFFAFQDAFSPAFLGPEYDPFIIDRSEQGGFSIPDLSLRSEERRVGKECRSGWWRCVEEKKK